MTTETEPLAAWHLFVLITIQRQVSLWGPQHNISLIASLNFTHEFFCTVLYLEFSSHSIFAG